MDHLLNQNIDGEILCFADDTAIIYLVQIVSLVFSKK